MKYFLLFLPLFMINSWQVTAQGSMADSLLEKISFHADIMVNADHPQHRIKAYSIMKEALDVFISLPGSYRLSLDSIPWISTLEGDNFRLLTWQLRISDAEYRYGGFIQWPDKVVALNDNRSWLNGSLRNNYLAESWYGALYYKLIPFESDGKQYHILFGFNAENAQINTKVADVLDLTGNQPRFGLPVFLGSEDPQTRLILTYADVSSVHLDYDPELDAIIHDHLITLAGVGADGQSMPVSDGSLEGWFLKNGKWNYQEEMYDVKSEEPPMTEERKDRKEDKDIMGRPKKEQ